MCRAYTSKRGSYVRLCYIFGNARGARIPFTGEPPIGPTGHYTGVRPYREVRGKKERRRCLRCRRPVSRHEATCEACKKELSARP